MAALVDLLPLLKALLAIIGPGLLYLAGNAKGQASAALKTDDAAIAAVDRAQVDRMRLLTDPAYAQRVRSQFTAR